MHLERKIRNDGSRGRLKGCHRAVSSYGSTAFDWMYKPHLTHPLVVVGENPRALAPHVLHLHRNVAAHKLTHLKENV